MARGSPRDAAQLLGPAGRLAGDLAGVALGAVLAAAAAARRGKAVHPAGAVHRAELIVPGIPGAPPGSTLLSTPARHTAIVRFSRSVGMPRPLPDLLGMSIRVLDCYGPGNDQDLLLVSSADHPLGHFIFLPARDVWQRPYTSSLPYRAGSDSFLLGALADPASPRPDGADELDRLDKAAATGELRFRIAVAAPTGRFRPVATLWVGPRLAPDADALRFNPWITGGGLEPGGWLNRTRRAAYPMSQAAWRTTRRGGGRAQHEAERAVARLRGASEPGAAALGAR